LQVVGQSYSGSSLLNALLASQEQVFGLGEAHHVYVPRSSQDTRGWGRCVLCKVPVGECPFYRDVRRNHFYEDCFSCSGANVLVDTSKLSSYFIPVMQPVAECIIVFLSKMLHEFVYSCVQHKPDVSIEEAFRRYIQCYDNSIDCYYSKNGKHIPTVPYELMRVTYRSFALHPAQYVAHICSICGELFSSDRMQQWCDTSSHIVGGIGGVIGLSAVSV